MDEDKIWGELTRELETDENEIPDGINKEKILQNIESLKKDKLNILFVGSTGVPKSAQSNQRCEKRENGFLYNALLL